MQKGNKVMQDKHEIIGTKEEIQEQLAVEYLQWYSGKRFKLSGGFPKGTQDKAKGE
jgi:hypothetical protein